MRREGQTVCVACEHTQWFDAQSPDGCVYFMSVADGMSFAGGARFSQAYVDRYKPTGSTNPPETMPALHYRNLVSDGNAWNASTSAEMCIVASFGVVNATAAGVFTRNVHDRRMKFRRWCGHTEILKTDDTLLLSPDYVSRQNANATSLAELVAGGMGSYTLSKILGRGQK
jgi:hypothetical protein